MLQHTVVMLYVMLILMRWIEYGIACNLHSIEMFFKLISVWRKFSQDNTRPFEHLIIIVFHLFYFIKMEMKTNVELRVWCKHSTNTFNKLNSIFDEKTVCRHWRWKMYVFIANHFHFARSTRMFGTPFYSFKFSFSLTYELSWKVEKSLVSLKTFKNCVACGSSHYYWNISTKKE